LPEVSQELPSPQVYRLVTFDKAPAAAATVVSNAFEVEDEYRQWYSDGSLAAGGVVLIAPPYHLKLLDRLCQENNALGPCIEALVTNVDGTGYEFDRIEDQPGTTGAEEVDPKIEQLEQFFAEVWPGVSFTTLRKELRRDLERTGNAYLEVVRNALDEITFLRRIDAKMMRLVKLDAPFEVEHVVRRDGKEVKVKMMRRERRFAQLINEQTLIFFKDFGVARDLNKRKGSWAAPDARLPAELRATEVFHFTALPDAHTPYGVPRWVSQMPSVLGSRKAEEYNLDFFDHGGVPPVMILLQGGVLASETRRALEQKTGGEAARKNRVQVIEVEPVGGSIDSPAQARVTIERFGAERQSDAMFEGYDEKCEMRIRRAFRLPPIFVGQAGDYSFATAFASYTVAEAQVFRPEREEFDEIISIRLLPAMGYAGYRLRSYPLQIKDVPNQLLALTLSKEMLPPDELIAALNEVTGLNLKLGEPGAQPAAEPAAAPAAEPTEDVPVESPSPAAKVAKSAEGILALATDLSQALRKRDLPRLHQNLLLAQTLAPDDQAALRQALATWQFIDPSVDPEGLAEIAGCTLAVMGAGAVQ
jgi:PBSX family phage portal protein